MSFPLATNALSASLMIFFATAYDSTLGKIINPGVDINRDPICFILVVVWHPLRMSQLKLEADIKAL